MENKKRKETIGDTFSFPSWDRASMLKVACMLERRGFQVRRLFMPQEKFPHKVTIIRRIGE